MEVKAEYRYTKSKEIGVGQGRNSHVFLSHDPQLNGSVAVKEIPKADFRPAEDFFREAKLICRAEHANVLPIRIAAQTPSHICLVMPFFECGSLADRIAECPIPLSDVQTLGQDILSGLGAIHASNIIHFDVKPTNILYRSNGVAMVADFGQAREMGPLGTADLPPVYRKCLPPECMTAPVGTVQTDIYQAGLTLYRAVNGESHFNKQVEEAGHSLLTKISRGRLPDRDAFLPHVPNGLRRVIRRALKLDPAERYESAAEFATALARVSIRLPWSTRRNEQGHTEWHAVRAKRPSIVVRLENSGEDWNVQIHTLGDGKKPRVTRSDLWKNSCTESQAVTHLKTVFETLE